MPFSSDGETIDFIYGVINWKRVDAARRASLAATVAPTARRDDRAAAASEMIRTARREQSNRTRRSRSRSTSDRDGRGARAERADRAGRAAAEPHRDRCGDRSPSRPRTSRGRTGRSTRTMPTRFRRSRWTTMPALPTACGPRARPPKRSRRMTGAPARRSIRRCRSLMISRSRLSASPQDYAELLEESGVKAQARAPMTPIVKLVFGIDYDKARLTEFAAALSYAAAPAARARRFPGLHRAASRAGSRRWSRPNARRAGPSRGRTRGRRRPRASLRGAPSISLADVAGGRGVRGGRHPPQRRRQPRAGRDRRR